MLVTFSPGPLRESSWELASALTPEGTLSSSKTTLWGNALLLTNSTVSPLATVILLGC